MSPEITQKELEDTIGIGEDALYYLTQAEWNLHSAKKWGIADILSGGVIRGSDKHERMKKASECLEYAKKNLLLFQDKLKDVQVNTDFNIDVSEFLTFADYFFDGIIFNFMVQRKISEARSRVANVVTQMESILDILKKQYRQLYSVDYVNRYD